MPQCHARGDDDERSKRCEQRQWSRLLLQALEIIGLSKPILQIQFIRAIFAWPVRFGLHRAGLATQTRPENASSCHQHPHFHHSYPKPHRWTAPIRHRLPFPPLKSPKHRDKRRKAYGTYGPHTSGLILDGEDTPSHELHHPAAAAAAAAIAPRRPDIAKTYSAAAAAAHRPNTRLRSPRRGGGREKEGGQPAAGWVQDISASLPHYVLPLF
jgi:hypothetical protein